MDSGLGLRPPRNDEGDSQAAVTLAPLLSASPAIKLHAFAAMAAFALGVVQLSAPKGTLPHRAIGWLWVVLMLVISMIIVLSQTTPIAKAAD